MDISSKKQLYFEDMEEGFYELSGGRTVTEADIVNFAGISGDFNPIHIDKEFAKKGLIGERIAHGELVMAMMSGLNAGSEFQSKVSSSLLAFKGIEEWRFTSPVKIGDTIHIKTIIGEIIDTKPNRGDIVFHVEIFNQDDVLVQKGKQRVVMAKSNFFDQG